MKVIDIVVNSKNERTLSAPLQMPESVEEAIEMWGDAPVMALITKSAVLGAQAFMRTRLASMNALEDGTEVPAYTEEEIITAVKSWVPGAVTRSADTSITKQIKGKLAGLSADKLSKILEMLGELT